MNLLGGEGRLKERLDLIEKLYIIFLEISFMGKIKTQEEIEKISHVLKILGKKVVTTNGSFDILHYAHVHLLEKARELGDVLIVLLNSDESVRRAKGDGRPIVTDGERAKMLAALECVSYVVIFNEDKPLELIARIRPDFHSKGGSWIEERIREERDLVMSWGGEFKNFELEEGFSTTRIIEKVLEKSN